MAKRIYRINALTAHLDPALDRPAYVDRHGRTRKQATKGVSFVQPGEPVELDAALGDSFLATHGGTVEDKPEKSSKAEKPKSAPKEKTDDTDKPA